jgi:aspartate/methionine/tyrosine aminotransferase
MSKAYGLPGLRIGWVVGPVDAVDEIWARHEYTSLSATMLSNHLAAIALSPQVRPRIIQRTRDYIRTGFAILQEWMDGNSGVFSVTPPQAAAIAFVRYHVDINSTQLTDRLREEKSVLIVPGDHFGIDRAVPCARATPAEWAFSRLSGVYARQHAGESRRARRMKIPEDRHPRGTSPCGIRGDAADFVPTAGHPGSTW